MKLVGVVGSEVHRSARVQEDLAAHVRIILELLHVKLIRAAPDLPVDPAHVVTLGVLAISGELRAVTEERAAVQAVEESFHDRAREYVEVLAHGQRLGVDVERGRHVADLFSIQIVAQIFNLPYRRVALGQAFSSCGRIGIANSPPKAIPRYGRFQICATADELTALASGHYVERGFAKITLPRSGQRVARATLIPNQGSTSCSSFSITSETEIFCARALKFVSTRCRRTCRATDRTQS